MLRSDLADKVELRARRDGASMTWLLSRRLAEVVAEELRRAGWAVSMGEAEAAVDEL